MKKGGEIDKQTYQMILSLLALNPWGLRITLEACYSILSEEVTQPGEKFLEQGHQRKLATT